MFKRLKAWWKSFMDTMPTPEALDLVSQGAKKTAEQVEVVAERVEEVKKPVPNRNAAIKNPPVATKNPPKKPISGTKPGGNGAKTAKKRKPAQKRG